MPNEVVGFKINGSTYEYDHEHLANLPTIDATPTANSTNAVQSGGVKSALDGIQAEIPTVDSTPTPGSNNAVSSGGVYEQIDGINNNISKAYMLDVDIVSRIPDNTDYDTIMTVGNYICATAQTASTLTNCPTSIAHRLTVIRLYNADRFIQIVHPGNGDVREYRRYYTGTSWRAWRCIAQDRDIPLIDSTFTQAGAGADAKEVGNRFGIVLTVSNDAMDYSGVNAVRFGISGVGKWSYATTGYQRSYTVRLDGVKQVRVTGHAENGSIIAFLNTYAPVTGEVADFATEQPERMVLEAGETAEFTVSGEMRYLYALLIDTSNNDRVPVVEVSRYKINDVLYPVDTETADETGKTDRSVEINAILATDGYCRLGKGVFYISNRIKMPMNSMLIGSGAGTVIKMLDSVESGSAIVMDASCTVKDLTVKGSSSGKATETTGDKHGIEWTGEELTAGVVDNCIIKNFSGSGIYLHDTTQKTYRNLSISNCYITGNRIGIYIRKDSEFNKITACTIIGNGTGYLNRGGNNDICNCGVDANTIGIQIDMDEGDNNGHGTISNCSFNHSDHNNGYGLIIKDTGRMLVNNCNIYYSKVKLDTTNGNVISNCGFGRNAGWEITDGESSLFIGCMVRGWDSTNSPVTITNNNQVKILNCFDRDGNPYTA